MVTVDIDVVDRKLGYNLLLDCSWIYAMIVIVSTVFPIILFPLDGRIVAEDQLSFFTPDDFSLPSDSAPLVGGIPYSYISIRTGLFKGSSVMGCFPLPAACGYVDSPYGLIYSS